MNTRTILGLVIAVAILGLLALRSITFSNPYTITIAAGPRTSESYSLAKALQKVISRHHSELSIEVLETRDSVQNMRLLAEGRANFTTAQADLVSDRTARLVCALYSDMFQLIANKQSGITELGDLIGKRVGLPSKNSGGHLHFQLLANHYGLSKDHVKVIAGTEHTVDWLFLNGDIDALFRVQAPGASSIFKLVDQGNGRLVPIRQAAALKLRHPTLRAGIIPEGSYQGRPAVPATDTPTIASPHLLLARSDVPDDVVFRVTSVLFEHRQELVELDPLAGSISPPERSTGTLFPVHSGALQFFDRERPSFLQRNAPALAVVVSLTLLYLSASLQFGSWRRRRAMSGYNAGLLQLAQRARECDNFSDLDQCRTELSESIEKIVAAGETGLISTSDISLFNLAYESAENTIQQRRSQLDGSRFRLGSSPGPQSDESGQSGRGTI
jgi:uncharacterized protein